MQNFLILCADCLRYDTFMAEVNNSPLGAELAQLDHLVFRSTYSSAPWTYPSTNSLLTGLYPHRHGARQQASYKHSVREPWPSGLAPGLRSVFTDLKNLSYRTLGISTIFWALNEGCDYSGCDKIIRSQGQDLTYQNIKAEWVVDAFAAELERGSLRAPFMAYLHFSDLHRSFDLEIARKHLREPLELLPGIEGWDIEPYLGDQEHLNLFKTNKVRLYEAVTRYFFEQLTRLICLLRMRGLLDNTTLFITSDHGDEFWDHEEIERTSYNCGYRSQKPWLIGTGHGHTMFNELMHVPLVMVNPGQRLSPEHLDYPVSLVDIYPTILQMAGIRPPCDIDGRSLLQPVLDREILMESTLYGFERKAVVRGSKKHVYSPYEDHFVAYDLAADPTEQNPVCFGLDIAARSFLDPLFALDSNATLHSTAHERR